MSNDFGSESNNPYAPSTFHNSPSPVAGGGHSNAMFQQITVVGILQIVVGSLEGLAGLLFTMYAFLFPYIATTAMKASPPRGQQPPVEVFYGMAVYFGVVAVILLLSATLRISSGVSSFWYVRRGMMIVSLIFGLLTSFSVYCSVLAIPLGIYGMVVMFHPTVSRAYEMRKGGRTPDQIRAELGR